MTTVFHSLNHMAVWYIYRDTEQPGERNFIERIKAPIFLVAVLTIEIM